MKKDKIKFTKRSMIFIVILLTIISLINYSYIKLIQDKKIIWRIDVIYNEYINNLEDKKIDFAFFGDSHAQRGVNPNFINNSFNFAKGGESYVETYYKLKKIIEQDKIKINNIILEIDPHSFSDKIRTQNEIFAEFSFYSNFVPIKEIANLKDISLVSILIRKHFPVFGEGKTLVTSFFKPIEMTPIYLGWEANTQDFSLQNKEQIAQERFEDHFTEDPVRIEKQSFDYFLNTLAFAKENKINIIFIKYPLTKEYDLEIEKHNLTKKEYYENIFKEVDKVLNDYEILDYYDIFFENPEYFSDSDHLNHIGAEILSKKIYVDLNKNNKPE